MSYKKTIDKKPKYTNKVGDNFFLKFCLYDIKTSPYDQNVV